MSDLIRLVSHRPWTVLGLLVLLTALAVSRIVDFTTGDVLLTIDPSTNRLLPDDDPDKVFYDYVRRLFGSDETMIVALHDDEDLFTYENLTRMRRITERIEAMPQVHHVLSLTNARNIRGDEEGINVYPFVREIPIDAAELDAVRREALANPVYSGNLVSRDGKTGALIIYFRDFSDAQFIEQGIDRQIAEIAREEAGDTEVHLTGGPHIKVAQYNYQNGDLQRSAPLILLASAFVLSFSFRRARGVILSLVTVVIALIWTLGVAGLIGKPLNVVTSLIVPLFLILPLSYCVHVVAEYYETVRDDPDLEGRDAIHRALRHVWLPVVLTGVTTGAGFVALVLSPIGAIQEFGLLAVAGIAATVLASLTVPGALLSLLGKPQPSKRPRKGPDVFTRLAGYAATFNLAHRREIFAVAAVILVASLLAATQLQVGAEGIRTFPADSSVRRDFDAVNAGLEGANLFNVVIQAKDPGAFEEPEHLQRLEELQGWLESQPEIGGTTSIVEYIKLCHRAFFENDPARFSIPKSRRLTTQILFFCTSDELEGFIDAPHQSANVIVRANVIETELVSALTDRIEAHLKELPESLSATVTGNPILINRLIDEIVRGQARSVLGAFVFI